MKKLIATLMALAMILALAMTAALAEEPAARTFRSGVEFGMDMEQVMERENQPTHDIDSRKMRGPVEFDELEYEKIATEGLSFDLKYLFVGNSLVAIHYDFADGTVYEDVKAQLTAEYGEAVPFDAAKIEAGRFAVDDDGELKDCKEMIEADENLVIVLEQDRDGDIDVTFVNMTAAYIKP